MSVFEVPVGASHWSFQAPEKLIGVRSAAVGPSPLADVRAAVRTALETPLRVNFPMRRAMTPGDRIALVIDDQLPQLASLMAGVLEYLAGIGIGPESVTVVTPPGASSTHWIDDLPDEFSDLKTETHQPSDRKLLSYLATTRAGHRVYLNRTLVDADQIISLAARRYDPQFGYSGGESSLFPALSDVDSRRLGSQKLTMAPPEAEQALVKGEAAEIAWLLGSPIFIQVIEGRGDQIDQICAGFVDSLPDGIERLDQRWRISTPAPADVVLAGLGARAGFAAMARAAAAASRAVRPDGAVVILCDAEPPIDRGLELLRRSEDCSAALRLLASEKPLDYPALFQWVSAASHSRIYLASGLRPDVVEELFATPIVSPHEVQRLLERSGACLVLADADKCLVLVD